MNPTREFRRTLGAAVLAVAALLTATVHAHTKSESYAIYEIGPGSVHLTFAVPETEAVRLAPALAANRVGDPHAPPATAAGILRHLTDDELGAYLAKHLWVTCGGAKPESRAVLAVGPRPLAASPGFRRFELGFRCADTQHLVLHSTVFFDQVPSHVSFARIRGADGNFIEQLFTTDHRELAIGGERPLQSASFGKYIRLGILHILTGPDHIAFLLGLLLISRSFRDLAFVITGFTIGHSITLALAVTGVIRPHAEFIDALIAVTIGLIGAENITVALARSGGVAACAGGLLVVMAGVKVLGWGGLPAPLLLGVGVFAACYLLASTELQDAARLRLVVTLVFGLVHGFAFAGDLIEMHLPNGRMAELLGGFNLGVEGGQLALVGLALALVWVIRQLKLAPPRALVVDLISSALVGLGLFWLVSRTYA